MASKRGDLAAYIANNSAKKDLALEVAAYLLATKQVAQLESLLRDVMTIREQQGHVEATVTSAHDLSAEIRKEIEQLIKAQNPAAKTVDVQPASDTSVVGGLKIRLAHQQLDMTIRAKLNTFKRLTAEGTNQMSELYITELSTDIRKAIAELKHKPEIETVGVVTRV